MQRSWDALVWKYAAQGLRLGCRSALVVQQHVTYTLHLHHAGEFGITKGFEELLIRLFLHMQTSSIQVNQEIAVSLIPLLYL